MPNYQKENNWILGEGVKIPKGMDFSIRLFSTLTEGFLNWAVDNRSAQLERILPRKNDIISKLVPTIALPVLESSANYSWFKEAPIVPVREQNLPAHLQYGAYTSEKEALLSSQIEGTQATLEDILDPMIEKNINQDIEEVVNYINAANFAIERLKILPLCNRLIKEIHFVLMQGVRGQDKSPGEFRRSQNWIGGYGATLKNAKYIPPCPQDMIEAMSDLEKYINAEDGKDNLIKAALIHYQFETIHPFLDGNGRVGRLLIMLFLIDRKILTTPTLYISYFLKKYRYEYYTRLSEVRIKGNFEQWIKFFLNAVNESAQDAVKTIDELSELHNKNEAKIQTLGRAKINTLRVFEYLEAHPIIDIVKTATALNLSFTTVSKAIKRLEDLEILIPTKNASRNRIFSYKEYLGILRRGT